jgi:hypothetical protein
MTKLLYSNSLSVGGYIVVFYYLKASEIWSDSNRYSVNNNE